MPMLKPYDITASLQGSVEQPEIDPSQLDEKQMRALMNQKILESFKAQQQRIQEAQKAYAEEAASPRNEAISKIDWRPFAQAVKGYGATTVAVPTEGPEDRSAFKRQLQQDVQRAEQGLTDDEINYMKTQLEDKQAAKDAATQRRFDFAKDLDIRSRVNNSEEAKQIRASAQLMDKLAGVENVIQQVGNKTHLTGDEKALLDAAFADASIAWKEAAKLGALQGPDLKLIETAMGETPTTWSGFGKYAISGGVEGLKKKLDLAKNRAQASGKMGLENIKRVYPYPNINEIYSGYEQMLSPKQAAAEDDEKKKFIQEFLKNKASKNKE